jgi:hypothetical protein
MKRFIWIGSMLAATAFWAFAFSDESKPLFLDSVSNFSGRFSVWPVSGRDGAGLVVEHVSARRLVLQAENRL